jgi:oligopeptidase B
MKRFSNALILAVGPALLAACAGDGPARPEPESMPKSAPVPPIAAVRPHVVESPHGSRTDEYYWLRDDTRVDPAVIRYLEAENAYKAAMTAHTVALEQKVYGEIVGRIKQDDSTVPYRLRGHWYYTRYETGQEYPVYARKAGTLDAPEQVMLDVNRMAEGHGFFQVGSSAIAPDNNLLAFTEDPVGRRQYRLRIKNLATGELLPDLIENVDPHVAWTADSRSILYVEKDPETLLARRVLRHVLGTDPAEDTLVYEQDDDSFYTSVGSTKDERYVSIFARSTVSTEMRYADAADPALKFRVFLPRERDLEYYPDHLDGRWIIRTNWQAPNYRLMEATVGEEGNRANWRELLAHREDAFVDSFDLFRNFLAIEERSDAMRKIRIRPWGGGKDFYIGSDEPAYTTSLGVNAEIDTHIVRYEYTSLTTPMTVYDYDIQTGERQLMKRTPVLGGFDSANYRTELVWAPARDGAKVPVSLVYRTGFRRDGSAPMLQYGYGSYGANMDPAFSVARVSLLDRGFVFALAHIRGGQEMGRRWYENGRLLHKKNSFTDFIDVTRHLVKEGYADASRVSAMGGSAGGLLMGAVSNMAPADYRAIVAQVPFVDVVTTMLDESIPLTTNEFDEWGNPAKKEYYDYMLSYSPYDNVARQAYPAILVTTGLHDSQVQYWEPAKWVARLRARKTDANPLLYRTTMEAGHGGKSGRFQLPRDRRGIRFHPRPVGDHRVSVSLGRIEQVAIPVRDLARATNFYRDRLGMKLLFEVPPQLAFFDCDGVRLALSISSDPMYDPPGSIVYYRVDDIEAAHAELERREVEFLQPPHRIAVLDEVEIWMAFFEDTEGNTLAITSEKPVAKP